MTRAVVIAAAAALALAAPGAAAEVVRRDADGRPMRFDVRVPGAPVDWAAALLRRSVHADEIAEVTIRLVSRRELASACGRSAGGCYRATRRGNVVVVPARRHPRVAHTILHEYGHHVDWILRNGSRREPNGGRFWWQARGMGHLRAARSVAFGYALGWERSVGEVFAEDYAQINGAAVFRIPWLEEPDAVVRRAILADLGLARPPAGLPRKPQVRPFVLTREGTLPAGKLASLRFGLLGPGRRAVVSVRLTPTHPGGRLEVVCGRRVRARVVGPGVGSAQLEARMLGPGRCQARFVNTAAEPTRFDLRLQVFLPR